MDKNCKLYSFSTFINTFGDSLETVVLSWFAYKMSGSAALTGVVFAVSFIPNIAFSLIAGAFAERHKKKNVVVAMDILRGISTFCFVVIISFYPSNMILVVYTFVNSIFETFDSPARKSLIFLFAKREDITKINSQSSSANSLGQILGLICAGLFVSILGIHGALVINAITYLLSATSILFMSIFEDLSSPINEMKYSYKKDIADGIRYLLTEKILLKLMIVSSMVNLILSPFSVLLPVYVEKTTHFGDIGLTIFALMLSLGTLFGAILISNLNDKFDIKKALLIGFPFIALSYAIFYLSASQHKVTMPGIIISLVASFTLGSSVQIIGIPIQSFVMRRIDQTYKARVISVASVFILVALPIGGLITSAISSFLPYYGIYAFFSVLSLLAILPIAFIVKSLRNESTGNASKIHNQQQESKCIDS